MVQGTYHAFHRRLLQPSLGEPTSQARVVGGDDMAKAVEERDDSVVVHVGEAALAYRPAIGVTQVPAGPTAGPAKCPVGAVCLSRSEVNPGAPAACPRRYP